MTFGPFSSSNVVLGIAIFDTLSNFSGNQIWQGTLNTVRTILPDDTLIIGAGALVVTLT